MTGRIALEQFGARRTSPEDTPAPTSAAAEPQEVLPAAAAAPEIDLEAERLACLSRIAESLAVVSAEQGTLRARCVSEVTAALGTAAETLLPQLARAGFAALVAETIQSILRRGRWPGLNLSVAPDQAAPIAAALGDIGAATEIEVTADPSLGPGEARLDWRDGGAEIDVEAIAAATLDRFRSQLGARLQQGT